VNRESLSKFDSLLRSTILATIAVPLLLIASCSDSSGDPTPEQDATTDVADESQDTTADDSAGPDDLLATFDVTERSGLTRLDAFVQVSVPFERGLVPAPFDVVVSDQGQRVPTRVKVLSRWPDGTARWLSLGFKTSFAGYATRGFRVLAGAPEEYEPSLSLPAIQLQLRDENGPRAFTLSHGSDEDDGQLRVTSRISVETENRARLTVEITQLDGDNAWNELVLEVARGEGEVTGDAGDGAMTDGDWTVAVTHPVDRGPVSIESDNEHMRFHIYPASLPAFPADEGFHVSREFVFEQGDQLESLAQRIAHPLRASLDFDYLDSTDAAGDLAPASASLDAAIESSRESLTQQMLLVPANRGLVAFGDFYDRSHGGAYLGYLLQEYDPATTFFLHYLRTGDAESFDIGMIMANQYADSLSAEGASFQHRATLHSIRGQVGKAAAERLRSLWRDEADEPASDFEILEFMGEEYGDTVTNGVQEVLDAVAGDSLAEREVLISDWIGFELAESAEQDLLNELEESAPPDDGIMARLDAIDDRLVERLQSGNAAPIDMARLYHSANALQNLELPSLDDSFRPYFQRYGGDWSVANFPAFHRYNVPNEAKRHQGGHSLIEMVVWAYLLSGDDRLFDWAMAAADYHTEGGLTARGLDAVEGQVDREDPIFVRNIGWPLINMLALRTLTTGREQDRDELLEETIEAVVERLLELPPEDYQGTIHAAVVGEGLARYHREYGGDEVLDYLIDLVEYWATNRWNADQGGFLYQATDPDTVFTSLSLLFSYPLAYAATQADNPLLADRLSTITAGFEEHTYAKSFAMAYRNTQRVAGLE